MSFFVAGFLTQDGIANGAIYALLAVALIVIFAVTRIIFVALGEFVSFAALSYAMMAEQLQPRVFGFVGLLVLAGAARHFHLRANVVGRKSAFLSAARFSFLPLLICGLSYLAGLWRAPQLAQFLASVALTGALGAAVYRIVYEPIADASSLVLLIVSIAVHLALLGMLLFFFGPQGAQTAPLAGGSFALGGVPIKGQSILIVLVAIVAMAVLFVLSEKTLYGKALRAAAFNPVGARLMGVSATLAGEAAFIIAAVIAGVCGALISAVTTIYYDTGFLLGLKGFVAAICGGMAHFPAAVAAAGALGLLESFSAFFASAFKEAIVFALVIPALLWLSFAQRHLHEDEA